MLRTRKYYTRKLLKRNLKFVKEAGIYYFIAGKVGMWLHNVCKNLLAFKGVF